MMIASCAALSLTSCNKWLEATSSNQFPYEKMFDNKAGFYDAITGVDVALSLLPDHNNKNVKVQVNIPGNTIVVEKNAKTFEDAVVDCADILKDKLVRVKEKRA